MHHTHTRSSQQQKRILKTQSNCDSYRFFNLLTSDKLFDKVESLLPAHREREFPPTETLSMFLSQVMSADRSCQNTVDQSALTRLSYGMGSISTNTGGYCRARKRLPVEIISELARYTATAVAKMSPPEWQWRGRNVRLVDGTTVTMPDTASSQKVYPQQGNQKAGLGFPICRIVGITCLSTGMLIDASIGRFNGKGGDERTLLRRLEESFCSGDLILADAFFASYFFIAAMLEKGVDILMQQNGPRAKVADFRKGTKLGSKDHLIIVQKPKVCPDWMTSAQYESMPASITVRECRVGEKVLVTTLLCHKTTNKQTLKNLYRKRWHVELDIRDIKTTMGMNVLSCKTPEMVVKEIWVYLLAYNLIRLMMLQSALISGCLPRSLSFKHCLQLWLATISCRLEIDEIMLTKLCTLMAQHKVGQRPGRIEPRAVKRRPKPTPLLMMQREIAREKIRKNGHPVKLK